MLGQPLPASPLEALPMLERVLRLSNAEAAKRLSIKEDQIANLFGLVIGFSETVASAGDLNSMSSEDRTNVVTLARWARHPEIEKSGNLIVLLSKNIANVSECLRSSSSNVESIKVPLPDFEERVKFARYLLTNMPGFTLRELNERSLASITACLTRENLRDLAIRSVNEDRPLDADMVWDTKKFLLDSASQSILLREWSGGGSGYRGMFTI